MKKAKKTPRQAAPIPQSVHVSPTTVSSAKLKTFFSLHWQLLTYVVFAILIRVWNFKESLYFIYDQGRDALTLQRIAQGDFILVGPTSGLSGFFLGPLWYYVGLPGYLLSGGNPYGICLWYIFLGSLAFPLYWWLSHRLFPKKFAVLTAILLAIIPGSLGASLTVWNPLISVPLMLGALYSFSKARSSRIWFGLGFLLVALTLQSEFAYAIFFLPPLFLLIPWLRKQRPHILDYVTAAFAVGSTLLPQLLFEVRNQFIMTKSLLAGMQDTSKSVSWGQLFQQRPLQLLDNSVNLILGPGQSEANFWLSISLLGLLLIGIISVLLFSHQATTAEPGAEKNADQQYLWHLVALFALIPYPFFMIWRGNMGYFFSYYLTCHFIFLVPLLVLGLQKITNQMYRTRLAPLYSSIIIFGAVGLVGVYSFSHWSATILKPINNGGLAKMMGATQIVYQWSTEQSIEPVIQVFTPIIYTEHYDYLFRWQAKQRNKPIPRTVRQADDKDWFLVIESWGNEYKSPIFEPWYRNATASGELIRAQTSGNMTIEQWRKN